MSILNSAVSKRVYAAAGQTVRTTLLGILCLSALLPLAASPLPAPPLPVPAAKSLDRTADGQIPILYGQAIYTGATDEQMTDRTLAFYPSHPVRRITVGMNMGAVFWSGDHRRVLSLGHRATVRSYNAVRGRFGPPVDAVKALADPGVRYALPLHEITQTSAVDWSRDGRTLCYYQAKIGFVLFDLRRGTRQTLRNPFLLRHKVDDLALSPDGRRIAFTVQGRDEFHAYFTASSMQSRIASPVRNRDGFQGDFFQDLWLIGRDGQGLHKLGHGMFPGWSLQGRFLLATEGSDLGGQAILRYDTQTGARQVLIGTPATVSDHSEFGPARYSPNGQQIAVFGPPNPKIPETRGLFLMSTQGTLLRTLATRQQLDETGIPSIIW